MDEEESIIRERLAVDERILRKIAQKLLFPDQLSQEDNQSSPTTLQQDIELLMFQVGKLEMMLTENEAEAERYRQRIIQIEEEKVIDEKRIESLKEQLKTKKEEYERSLEYEKVAEEILKYPCVQEIQLKTDLIRKECREVEEKTKALKQLTEQRAREIETYKAQGKQLAEQIEQDTVPLK